MSASVLGSLSLGYQFLWDRQRQPAAVRLFVNADAETPVDARHLLAALDELWPGQAPQLLLSIQSLPLFLDLLEHGDAAAPWLEVPADWFGHAPVTTRVEQSLQRGLALIWRGHAGQQMPPELAPRFHKSLLELDTRQVLACLAISARQDEGAQPMPAPISPAQPGQICLDVRTQALGRHCLDQQDVWALAGWPTEDVLRQRRGTPVAPSRQVIDHLLAAIQADASIEAMEQIMGKGPILTFRFLEYANSPELGLRHEVESVRQGLMALGLSKLQAWLHGQLASATAEPDLDPIRTELLMRAHLMDKLLEAGEEQKLRNEIYLCGLLSGIEPLLGEPLAALLERLPLSWRVRDALLKREGPYVPYLDIATSLATAGTDTTHQLCEAHELDMEDVNRALLRALLGTVGTPLSRASGA